MSVKEILRKSSAQFIDVSPVLPDGVRIVTREKSASEVLREEKRWLLLSENQVVNVHEDWELRWWCTQLNVTKEQLVAAVKAVGPGAKKVAEYLARSDGDDPHASGDACR